MKIGITCYPTYGGSGVVGTRPVPDDDVAPGDEREDDDSSYPPPGPAPGVVADLEGVNQVFSDLSAAPWKPSQIPKNRRKNRTGLRRGNPR